MNMYVLYVGTYGSPSKVLKDSNISISFTGPNTSEYFVAI
jgi:hypothetical protein